MPKLRANTDWNSLMKRIETETKNNDFKKEVDERFYVPGKDGLNVEAVIRFLPSPNGPAIIEEKEHWFKGPVDAVTGNQKTYK
jgi:hypothetical protein